MVVLDILVTEDFVAAYDHGVGVYAYIYCSCKCRREDVHVRDFLFREVPDRC